MYIFNIKIIKKLKIENIYIISYNEITCFFNSKSSLCFWKGVFLCEVPIENDCNFCEEFFYLIYEHIKLETLKN